MYADNDRIPIPEKVGLLSFLKHQICAQNISYHQTTRKGRAKGKRKGKAKAERTNTDGSA